MATTDKNILQRLLSFWPSEEEVEIKKSSATITNSYGSYRILGSVGYNGEKNFGEIGPIKDYWIDYAALRYRSWQLYLESEIFQMIILKWNSWMIGGGLKLQSEPIKKIFEEEKINLDTNKFSESIEARFSTYAKSRRSSYSSMKNLNMLSAEAHKNAMIAGDVLVILRYVDYVIKVQLIDGNRIQSPVTGDKRMGEGNRIIHGVEVDETGRHVAYYVRKNNTLFETDRVPAYGKSSGMLQAFMVYGNSFRIDETRGMPLLSAVFESIAKLERYKEATVGSAEERQKIPYSVEHDYYSSGENPLAESTMKAWNVDGSNDGKVSVDDLGQQVADKVTTTMNKMAFNLPIGAHLKAVESKNELYFKDFYDTNIKVTCATVGIPYEVALSAYNSNYSASRASMKDWENQLGVSTQKFSFEFMQPIYNMFLHTEALRGTINAPGYLEAWMKKNYYVVESYQAARFVGKPVPHIDPVKEVKAEREKLGILGTHIPLTTVESATETLGGGDAGSNIDQFASEIEKAKGKGLKQPEPTKGNQANPGKKTE